MFIVDTHGKWLATLTTHVLQYCTCRSVAVLVHMVSGASHLVLMIILQNRYCHNVNMSEDKFHQTLVSIYYIIMYPYHKAGISTRSVWT